MLLDLLYWLSSDKSDLFLLLYFLQFLSSEESDSLDYESDDDASESRSTGMCTFPFRFENSVGRVCGMGPGFFVPIGIDSKCDVFS